MLREKENLLRLRLELAKSQLDHLREVLATGDLSLDSEKGILMMQLKYAGFLQNTHFARAKLAVAKSWASEAEYLALENAIHFSEIFAAQLLRKTHLDGPILGKWKQLIAKRLEMAGIPDPNTPNLA